MKNSTILASLSITALLTSASIVYAQGTPPPNAPYYAGSPGNTGFTLGGDVGVSIMQNFNSSRMGFPGRFSTRPGGRLDIAPEYDFLATDKLALGVDFETGVIENDLHQITDAGVPTYAHGEYYQVPIVGDVILRLMPDSFVTPFIGAGGGGDWSHMRINRSYYFGPPGDNDEIDPAVQAMAGVLFRLNSNLNIGVSYKWLAALPGGSQNTYTHAVTADFMYRF